MAVKGKVIAIPVTGRGGPQGYETSRLSHFLDNQLTDGGKGKDKSIPVTGRGGPQGCETSRLPHFLDNRLTDGGETQRTTPRTPPIFPTIFYFCSGGL
jgi:hypothetical protein